MNFLKLIIALALIAIPLNGVGAIHHEIPVNQIIPSPQIIEKYVVQKNNVASNLLDLNPLIFSTQTETQESFKIIPIAQYSLSTENAVSIFIENGIIQTVDRKLSVEIFGLLSAVKVSYSGTLTASLLLNEKDDETSISLSKNISPNSVVTVQTIENVNETRQMISLAMSF